RLHVAPGLSMTPVQFSSSRWKLPTAPPAITAMNAPPGMLPLFVMSIVLVTPPEPTRTEPKLVGSLAGVSAERPPSPLRSAVVLTPPSETARNCAENGVASWGWKETCTEQASPGSSECRKQSVLPVEKAQEPEPVTSSE